MELLCQLIMVVSVLTGEALDDGWEVVVGGETHFDSRSSRARASLKLNREFRLQSVARFLYAPLMQWPVGHRLNSRLVVHRVLLCRLVGSFDEQLVRDGTEQFEELFSWSLQVAGWIAGRMSLCDYGGSSTELVRKWRGSWNLVMKNAECWEIIVCFFLWGRRRWGESEWITSNWDQREL